MQKIKLFATLLTVALSTTMFVSCNTGGRGSANVIEIRNAVNVSGNIVTVGVALTNDDDYFTVATGEWTDGSVTLTFSEEIPEAFLTPITENFNGFSISDESAKIGFLAPLFWALDRHNNLTGSFVVDEIIGSRRYAAAWVYANRNVRITGTNADVSVDINLRKGWNIIYTHQSLFGDGDIMITTRRPSAMNFEWTFVSGNNAVGAIEINNMDGVSGSVVSIDIFNNDLLFVSGGEWDYNSVRVGLPLMVRFAALTPVTAMHDFGEMYISNPQARILDIEDLPSIWAIDSNGNGLGFFRFVDQEKDVVAQWMFADREVVIIGGDPEFGYIELDLSRGWNIIYLYVDEQGRLLVLTQRPSGVNLEWRFFPSEY